MGITAAVYAESHLFPWPGARLDGWVLPIQVAVGDRRVDAPGNRDDAAGGVNAAVGDRLEAPGLQGESEVHRFNGVAERPRGIRKHSYQEITIAIINTYNRLNVITRNQAGDYQPGQWG
jgi:hypothetical protein